MAFDSFVDSLVSGTGKLKDYADKGTQLVKTGQSVADSFNQLQQSAKQLKNSVSGGGVSGISSGGVLAASAPWRDVYNEITMRLV